MGAVNQDQLQRLIEDMDTIKSVLKKNAPILHQIMLPRHFRLTSLLAGLAVIVISLVYYYLMTRFGGYDAIPLSLRRLLIGLVIVAWVLLGLVKNLTWTRSLTRVDPSMTYRAAMREFFSPRVMHIYLPVMVLIVALVVFLIMVDLLYYIVPTLSIGISLVYIYLGAVTAIRLYLLTGYWCFVTGLIVLFIPLTPPVALSLTVGCGFLLFALMPEKRS